MKTARIVIIFGIFVWLTVMFGSLYMFYVYVYIYENYQNKELISTPDLMGLSDVDISGVDISGAIPIDLSRANLSDGTTDLKYEPEEAVVLDDTVRYNSDNFDLTYHDLNKYAGLYETNLKNVQVRDPSSKRLITLPYAPAQELPVYYDISKRVYGPFRPTYADSVLLSHYR